MMHILKLFTGLLRPSVCLVTVALAFYSMDASCRHDLTDELQSFIHNKDARIGIAVIVDGCDTVSVNGTRDFPMLSVYKFPQALAVIDYCINNNISIRDSICVSADEIKPDTWSPLRDKYGVNNLRLPISELLAYSLQLSDNNACDILFRLIGGTAVSENTMRKLGLDNIFISATEDEMHKDLYLCYLNRTTPLDMAILFDRFYTMIRSSSEDYQYIARLIENCATGADRLHGGITGEDVMLGHKTGTGDKNSQGRIIAVNDCGYVIFPDGYRYSIAVFIADSAYDMDVSAKIIADISSIVYKCIQNYKSHKE